MAEAEQRPRLGPWDAIVGCLLIAVGVGCLIGGKLALGSLTLLLLAANIVGLLALRRGSERAVLVYAVARPLFFGAWLLALAGVIFASHTSSDWIIVLPLAFLSIGLGIALVVVLRRVRARPRHHE
jgi:hypothetical protein